MGSAIGHWFGLQQFFANSIENFISHENKCDLSLPKICIKTFWLSKWVSIAIVVARFPQASLSLPTVTVTYSEFSRKHPVFVLARQTRLSFAGALPKELCHWFCSQNLRLSSRIAFGCEFQMTCRGLNLPLPDQRVANSAKVLSALKSQNNLCGVWILFKNSTPKFRTAESPFQPLSTSAASQSCATSTLGLPMQFKACFWAVGTYSSKTIEMIFFFLLKY